jgi:hypothetical protein
MMYIKNIVKPNIVRSQHSSMRNTLACVLGGPQFETQRERESVFSIRPFFNEISIRGMA